MKQNSPIEKEKVIVAFSCLLKELYDIYNNRNLSNENSFDRLNYDDAIDTFYKDRDVRVIFDYSNLSINTLIALGFRKHLVERSDITIMIIPKWYYPFIKDGVLLTSTDCKTFIYDKTLMNLSVMDTDLGYLL